MSLHLPSYKWEVGENCILVEKRKNTFYRL